MPKTARPLAWVESPLQLLGAAEWAHASGDRVDLAGRLAPQVEQTAAELARRGALFGEQAGFWGIPWRMLARHDHWLVGDGFSGQFRLAAALLRPKRITFLDDGLNAVAFVDAITGAREFARPGIREGAMARRLAPLAHDVVRLAAAAGDVEIFTAFPLGDGREERLADLGARVTEHGFEWLRGTAQTERIRDALVHDRIVLGSAGVVDGLIPLDRYVAWVRAQSQGGALYLPHRRESLEQIAAVASACDVGVVQLGLPIEVVLSGDARRREIATLPSSAVVTLGRVLAGTDTTIRETSLSPTAAEEPAR